MDIVFYLILFVILFVGELLYFRIADKYNIIDKPNERSSHTSITLRGGGVIFVLAPLLYFLFNKFQYPWFTLGFLLIAIISLADDIKSQPARLRLLVHLVAVSLMFYQLQLFSIQWWWVVIAYILVIGTINAYNFMDGINGITGAYSLVFLISAYLVVYRQNAIDYQTPFIETSFIAYSITGVLVFLLFNFRKKAKCFAGDVGSVSMAFIVLFLLIKLILTTGDYKYILLLSVYGVDSVLTIIHRILLKENIFEAHRRHLYQYLTNTLKWPHLAVSTLYAVVQLAINVWVIYTPSVNIAGFAVVLVTLGVLYVVSKRLIISGAIKPAA